MKLSPLFFLLLCFILGLNCTPKDPKTPLTNAEVIRIYENHSGEKINDPDGFCIESAHDFPGVYSLGWFAHDAGCMGSEVLFGGKIGSNNDISPAALAAYGWAEVENREKLALDWVQEVVLAWETGMSSGNEDFGGEENPEFSAPSSKLAGKNVEVELWVRDPGGMLPVSVYGFVKVKFDDSGKIIESERVNSFTVEY